VALWAGRCGDPLGDSPDVGLLELAVLDVLLALRQVRASFGARPGGVKVRACAS
jgi:hypothetical protein